MIIGNKTRDGTDICKLTISSNKLVLRECEECKRRDWRRWGGIKTDISKKLCYICSKSGKNNSMHLAISKEKMSKAKKGKPAIWKNGKDPRIINKKLTKKESGYILNYNDKTKEYEFEHRQIIEKSLGRKLTKEELIHHVDGDKINNKTNNLYICHNRSEHQLCHMQLNKLSLDLVKRDVILFNHKNGKYYFNPKLEIKTLEKSIGFNEVAIKQKQCVVNSRKDINIESEVIRGIKIKIPIIASNMNSVVNSDFIIRLFQSGSLGILHRAMSDIEIINEVKKIKTKCDIVCASIGIGQQSFELAQKLIREDVSVINIDVAHGYCKEVINIAKAIKAFSKNIKIIVGNTTNPDMILDTYKFADAIKIGIGQGLACETANTAGCTEKMMSVILKFKELAYNFGLPIISDGGIRSPSDFSKGIGGGASSVMAGSIFARCPESAGEIVEIDGIKKKIYSGMASRAVQEKWSGRVHNDCPEGKTIFLDLGESVENLLNRYAGALRSAISYAGCNNIDDFKKTCEFLIV